MNIISHKKRSCWKGLFLFKNRNNMRIFQPSKRFLNKRIVIKNGKFEKRIVILKKHLYNKLGAFVMTKRLGYMIHILKKYKRKRKKK